MVCCLRAFAVDGCCVSAGKLNRRARAAGEVRSVRAGLEVSSQSAALWRERGIYLATSSCSVLIEAIARRHQQATMDIYET